MKFSSVIAAILALVSIAAPGAAQDKEVKLHVPDGLIETGLLRHILPRFSLKTQVRVALVGQDEAEMVLGETGRPVMEGLGRVWHLKTNTPDADTERFAAWLLSEVGQRTIMGFAPQGTSLFRAPELAAVAAPRGDLVGDADLGYSISRQNCTRCHAVDDNTQMSAIGSTPSFAILRSLPDWQERFEAFYVLKPHGSFTQIEGVTAAFPPDRPSPLVPITLTVAQVEAVVAYVAGMEAADLGQPLIHK